MTPLDDAWWPPLDVEELVADFEAWQDELGWDDFDEADERDSWALAATEPKWCDQPAGHACGHHSVSVEPDPGDPTPIETNHVEATTSSPAGAAQTVFLPSAEVRGLIDWFATLVPDHAADAIETPGEEPKLAELIDLIAGLEQVKGAIAATQARATAQFGRATVREALANRASLPKARSSIAPQIALARRCSPATADRHLGLARALPGMPHTQAALTAGVIDERCAAAIVREPMSSIPSCGPGWMS